MKKLSFTAAGLLFFSLGSFAQTSSLEGDVKGEDGQPLRGALVKIERQDIKGNYKVKTDKKGHYFHAGLPLGTYRIVLEIEGKDRDRVEGVRTRLGDPVAINFDLQAQKRKQEELSAAAQTGELTKEQARDMTPEQKAAMEKAMKEREQSMAKQKGLNDAFVQGMEALKTKQFEAAIDLFTKASEMDPKQHVVWANLAEASMLQSDTKTGADQEALRAKGLEAFAKAIELNPADAAYHNNYALALAKSNKFAEATGELEKAAQIDPTNAGRYFYNLGALLTNRGQLEPAGESFKKAADAGYADAYYQYGIYLTSKAQTVDGKFIPAPGTREAFEKYIELKPDGRDAESAKAMIATMSAQIQTTYENPDTKKKGSKKGR
ncbi:MAG: carboxypeptidase regulatory-like domain-containing protein [Bryobacteraceae bacterium]